ncbi:MAG: DNA replication and repair protein RecF [Muribaculaceae bacterium]|nr:DNA replication and repair protein RecF [Muribaculaceae bacterium]MDE7080434.1 DNA replication and repair protein RecF [Muribaculaceae bacterium]
MVLNRIEILDFKNIPEARLDFSPGVNCLVGLNGMGKSNMLEAIHMMCLARAMSSIPESALIRHGADMLAIKGDFTSDAGTEERVAVGIVRGKGKSLKRNGKEYERISAHIGAFPLVSVTPADSMLVSGSAEERRRLTDMVISQADPVYLSHLIRYNRSLESRNRMLRAGVRDDLLYESVEAAMNIAATEIHAARTRWVADIAPRLSEYYSLIAGNSESASIEYRSVLNDATLPDVLAASRAKDIALGYTSKGVHRDDLATSLGDYSMRRLGSQGQVKSFILALRLAIFDFLKASGGKTPILLLDDIFDKLDASRVEHILKMVSSGENFGQIFITDTNRSHIDSILTGLEGDTKLFEVTDGAFTENT